MANDTHAKSGMKKWVDVTERVARSRGVDHDRAAVSGLAYDVYKTRAIHQELLQLGPVPAPLAPRATEIRAQVAAATSNLRWEQQGGLAHRAKYAPHTPQRGALRARKREQAAEGLSSRFSLTSDVFLPGGAGSAVAEYRKLAQTTADWLTTPSASGAKVMQPGALRSGRADHAVLYSNLIRDQGVLTHTAQQLSQQMGATASAHTPLGMENIAPGVAYAEFARTQRVSPMPGISITHPAPGYGQTGAESSSFGMNRAHIISGAIQQYRELGRKTDVAGRRSALGSALSSSIHAHGYDTINPARVRASVVATHDYRRGL